MSKDRIALLYGGPSVERDISLMTAQNVKKAFKKLGLSFFEMEAHFENLKDLKKENPSRAFLAVHGPYGEDGTLQGLLEYLKIPYTASGVFASALCMDKMILKNGIKKSGILTPDFKCYSKKDRPQKAPFRPCVVKPRRAGSSLGISIVKEEGQFKKAIELAFTFDSHILIEEFIEGSEMAVSWLEGQVLTPIEIKPPAQNFYDFKRKYEKGHTEFILPPERSESLIQNMKSLMEKAVHLCQVRSYARGDFIIDHKDQAYFLEMNTLPGLTPLSLLPMSAQYHGVSYPELISKILSGAALDY